jgi:hypothetical protein
MINSQVWLTTDVLTSGETRTVKLGVHHASGQEYLDASGFNYLTYSLVSELACTLQIRGGLDAAFAYSDNLWEHSPAGGIQVTPYNLGGGAGQGGYLVIPSPFIKIYLLDTATANHAYTRLFVKAWR